MPSSFFDATDDLPSMSYSPEVAKLLSASSYPHTPVNTATQKAPGNELLYGGFMAAQESAEEDEVQARPKKRSKTNQTQTSQEDENSPEAPKRQRGRPKVSTRDETAAERRRTQIRLAQRAYRNRKEKTITELNQRVESLQATLRTLNSGVTRLHEELVNMGIIQVNTNVAREIEELLRQISYTLESTSPDQERASSEEEDAEVQGQEAGHDRNQLGPIGNDTSSTIMQGQTFPGIPVTVPGISVNLLEASANHTMLDLEGQSLTDFQNFPALPTKYPTSFVSKNDIVQPPSHPIMPTNSLALTAADHFPSRHSYTYSFQETSFERRLIRFCSERAYQRLISPHTDPAWLFRTFRLTFNFVSRESLTQGFKRKLARSIDEPLENWSTPWITLGGAGTHFPKLDEDGNPVYPPNMLTPRKSLSQWRQPDSELVPPADTLEGILSSTDMEGEWFDSHDVEGYLASKGIFPEPHSSFFVVDSSLVDPPALVESEFTGTTASSSISTPWPTDVFEVTAAVDPDPAHSSDNWLGGQDTYAANSFDLELQQPAFDIPQTHQRFLTIEVEKFLERLSDNSTCLGRAPGFRKHHVDMALSLAMQEAF